MLKKTLLTPAIVLASAPLWAQSDAYPSGRAAPPVQSLHATGEPLRAVELSTGYQRLTGGYGNWRDVTLRGTYGVGDHVVQGEVAATRRFHESGAFLVLSDAYTFNADWYGSVAVGAGDGAFYLPRYRVDASLSRKMLEDRRLVGTLGLGYYRAPDGHTDRIVTLNGVYYFTSPWIAEAGVRFNSSNPGSVRTRQQFLAATWGRDKQDLVSARHTWGSEGYQTLAEGTQLVNFRSRETTLSWRHWFNPRTGVLIGAVRYTNPLYRRSGINLGLFHNI